MTAIHEDSFDQLFAGYTTMEAWISNEPPVELAEFFIRARRVGADPFQLSYKLESDLDYLMTNINRQLFLSVQKAETRHRRVSEHHSTSHACPDDSPTLCRSYHILVYRQQNSDIQQFTDQMQKIVRAVVLEAFDLQNNLSI